MLIFSKSLEFLWGEAIATACFTQNRFIIHTRYNKTPYELIKGRKPNVQYFHVFGSLCYPTNDRDDLGKMKTKADIRIFIGYSESSRGFHSSKDSNAIPSKEDLDNLFGPLYEEYYAMRSLEVSDNSAANTLDNKDTPSSSSIVVKENEAPQIVTSSEEPVTNEPTTLVSNDNADESVQEDVDPSNMLKFHQKHRFTNRWTKNHPIEQVIEPHKHAKKLCLDHKLESKSMQDKLNQFKRLDVWELVARLADGNVIKSTRESYEDFVRSSSNDSNLSEYFVATVAHKTYHDFAQIGMVKWGRAWSMFPVAEVGGVLGAEMCCGAQREEVRLEVI
ncbi:retrovirus-related pol polyprotein from transposon TNT 1-94 [Tanacetum coccineum]